MKTGSIKKKIGSADIVIVGAALTGQLLASVLADKFKIILLDEKLPIEASSQKGGRTLALSYQSLNYLVEMGFATDLNQLISELTDEQNLLSTIDGLGISQFGKSMSVDLNAKDYGLPFLGVCVQASHLISILLKKNQALIKSNWINQKLKTYQPKKDEVELTLENGNQILTKLVIFASGNQAHIDTKDKTQMFEMVNQGLNCSCLVGSINLNLNARAYQRYSKNGVFALLPLSQNRTTFVYSFNDEFKNQLHPIFEKDNQLKDSQLTKLTQEKIYHQFQSVFPKLFKKVSLKEFQFAGLWPIKSSYSKKIYQNRSIMMGAGAVSFSPIAAQGFNLTINNSWELYQVLKNKTIEIDKLCSFAVEVEKKHQQIRIFMELLEEMAFQKRIKNHHITSQLLSAALFSLNIPIVRDFFLSHFVGKNPNSTNPFN